MKILPVIRTTEMRYIKAEILAKRGQFDKAYEILNQIRHNRNMWNSDLQQQNTMDKFLRDMVNDAQREFLSEGQLFYLYKRLNYDVQIGNTKRKMTKAEYMFPIPVNQNM
ncbi:protein containing RagB/SusD domain protein [gut metagenome]|uniref:Protein containing RagB/SusD domain protein n=1 Tax=gut metagenome TaxID=749906 RepID=J9GYS0_9ZZZZ